VESTVKSYPDEIRYRLKEEAEEEEEV